MTDFMSSMAVLRLTQYANPECRDVGLEPFLKLDHERSEAHRAHKLRATRHTEELATNGGIGRLEFVKLGIVRVL